MWFGSCDPSVHPKERSDPGRPAAALGESSGNEDGGRMWWAEFTNILTSSLSKTSLEHEDAVTDVNELNKWMYFKIRTFGILFQSLDRFWNPNIGYNSLSVTKKIQKWLTMHQEMLVDVRHQSVSAETVNIMIQFGIMFFKIQHHLDVFFGRKGCRRPGFPGVF